MSAGRFNLSALAVRERSVTLFLIILISVAGLVAFFGLGRAEDPPFTVKQMTVITVWPGATAQEMQDQVAEPLEKRLQELKWYDRTETYTRPGIALLTLSLQDQTPPSEVPEQFYQARKKLGDEAKNLPAGVSGPMMNDEFADVTFALFALKARGEPPRQLVRDAEALRQQLLHVPGVKKVNILGEQAERIYLSFSHDRLATLGLSPEAIFAALNSQNVLTAAGAIETRGGQIFIRLDGAFDRLQQIRDTPIIAGGRTLKLADVATVERGYEDPATFLIRNQGEPALLLGVVMREGWNGLALGKALDAETTSINQSLPLGMSLTKVTDQSVNISAAVDEFMIKFFVALLVVMAVCFVSMGWRVGVVVAAAVPLTLAVVFVVMAATGKNFDRITLGSLILALGLLVDDAIIAIEMMVVKMEEGYDRLKASAYAWSHTAAPMLAGTLVTAVGFMPNGFAQSTAGEYASNVFWIVGIALIASWIVAVIFTPWLGVHLLPNRKPAAAGHAALYDTPRYQRFRRLLTRVIAHKWRVAAGVVALFIVAILGMSVVKKQFFPTSDRPEVLVEVQLPYGSSISQTSAAAAKITLVGSGGQRVPLSQIGDVSIRMEDPLLRRRDRTPTITVRGDVAENLQPPDVSTALMKPLQPIIDSLPPGYRIETAGSIEESGKATRAMVPLFPIMIALTLLIIILQVRSLSAMVMVFLTAPLGLIGVVPTLLLFNQPFGINALVGLIALSGILMRNTLILIGQIHHNQQAGLDPFHAVVEATVQRARPVLLTALAAILAFIPLTHSVFWGTLAYTLIGGTLGGTIMTLIFLPAMYAIWFRIRPENTVQQTELHLQR